MRTTVDLPDDLLAEAKVRAARERRTLSAVIGDALRASFARRPDVELSRPVELPTYGHLDVLVARAAPRDVFAPVWQWIDSPPPR